MKKYFLGINLFLSILSFSQTEQPVLNWKASNMLHDYLNALMHDQYAERKQTFKKAITSISSFEEYRQHIKQSVKKIFGTQPKKTALEPMITGWKAYKGYRIEKIIYESLPGHHVTANLYIPSGEGKFPAVLFFCGHEAESKATMSYQQTAVLLVRNGFIVMLIDPISQGERYQLVDSKGHPLTKGGTTEHTLLNGLDNLLGTSVAGDEFWDNEQGMAYLMTRVETDTARVGCMGNSGGGMQAIYFAALDDRIKFAVPCSYLSSREITMDETGPADGCAQVPDEGKYHLEMQDYLFCIAPKPLMVLAGRYDFINYWGTVAAFSELQQVYQLFGKPDLCRLFTYADGHGISAPKREAGVRWLRAMMYRDTIFKQEEIEVLPGEKDLMASAQGQITNSYKDELTIVQRDRDMYDTLSKARTNFLATSNEVIREKVLELLQIRETDLEVPCDSSFLGMQQHGGISYRTYILRKGMEPPIPVLLALPEIPVKNIVILLHERGKKYLLDSVVLLYKYLSEGSVVVMADLRGMGESEDKELYNDPKYCNREYRNAMLSLHIGKNLPGMRVSDIQTIVQFIQSRYDSSQLKVSIQAWGTAVVPAIYYTYLNKHIEHVWLEGGIRSYRELMDHPLMKDAYSYIVPDVSNYFDLENLIENKL